MESASSSRNGAASRPRIRLAPSNSRLRGHPRAAARRVFERPAAAQTAERSLDEAHLDPARRHLPVARREPEPDRAPGHAKTRLHEPFAEGPDLGRAAKGNELGVRGNVRNEGKRRLPAGRHDRRTLDPFHARQYSGANAGNPRWPAVGAAMARKKKASGGNVIAANRRARFDYQLEDRLEAGLALEGWEVKSLRSGRAQITEGYVTFRGGEAFLQGAHFSPLPSASTHVQPDPVRARRLLLHRREIDRLAGRGPARGLYRGAARSALEPRSGKARHRDREGQAPHRQACLRPGSRLAARARTADEVPLTASDATGRPGGR